MSRRGWVLFVVMSLIWGLPYLLIKVADGGVSVPVLVFARVTVGALVLLPITLRRRELGALRGHWAWLVAFAVTELIGPFALLASAERRLPSSTSGLLVAAVPIIGAILARLTGGQDRLTAVRWAGLIIGFGGVALLAGPDAARGDALSVAEVLLTALGYAIGPIIANRKLSGLPPVAANTVCLGMAAVAYAPAAALTWPHSAPSVQVLASLAALGAICTAAGFVVYFGLIAEVGAARATVITYVNPAVAVALGVLVLGEHFTVAMAGSFALILAGSILATRANPGGRRPAPQTPLAPRAPRTPRAPWTSRVPWSRRVRPAAGPLGDRGPSATEAAADGPGPCRAGPGEGPPAPV